MVFPKKNIILGKWAILDLEMYVWTWTLDLLEELFL